MAEEPLFEVEYDDDGRPTHMHVGKHGIRLSQEDAQRIFDEYFDMRDTVDIMREENAKLKAQNKWLRKEYTALRKTREQEFKKSCEAATNSMGQISTLRYKNVELRELATEFYSGLVNIGHCLGMFHKCTNHACRNIDIDARCCRLQLALLKAERMGIKAGR